MMNYMQSLQDSLLSEISESHPFVIIAPAEASTMEED